MVNSPFRTGLLTLMLCFSEHIWWDQGTTLRQAGILPTHIPYPTLDDKQTLRLPVAGAECARMLIDEASGNSNEMFGRDWGVQQSQGQQY
jgi:carboxymethylenebutenolidase